jgi:hypothetical protein
MTTDTSAGTLTMTKADSRASVQRRRRLKIGGLSLWAVIVTLIMLWQTVSYQGVIAVLAEWQFNIIGRYYPAITYLILVTLLMLPGLLLFKRREVDDRPDRMARAAVRSGHRFFQFLAVVGGALATAALVTLLAMWWLPALSGPLQVIDLSEPVASEPHEGPTVLKGSIAYDRTAAFDENLFVVARNSRFAPMLPPGNATPDYQYFVELPPAATPELKPARTSMTGNLRRGSLPGEIVRLYRYAGARVETPYYVLLADTAAVRWPYLQVAIQTAVASLLFLLAGVWQWLRLRRMRRNADAITVDPELTA